MRFMKTNTNDDAGYQAVRIADIIHSTTLDSEDPYLSFLIIWDYWSMGPYKSNWVNIICKKLSDYQLINSEEERIVKIVLNEEIQSTKISRIGCKIFYQMETFINAADLIEGIYNIKDEDQKTLID